MQPALAMALREPTRLVVGGLGEGVWVVTQAERPPGTTGWRGRSDVSERCWVTVENTVEIARSPEDVFDY